MTREAMDAQLGRMVILRNMPGDSEEYWRVFQQYPDHVFAAGVDKALDSRTWYPTPTELKDDCKLARPTKVFQSAAQQPVGTGEPRTIRNPLPGGRDIVVTEYRDWVYYCEHCSDEGRRSRWCGKSASPWPWVHRLSCDRRHEHGDHEWVEACPCAATNPAVLRRKELAEAAMISPKSA
jgi:hypothetical protein